MAPCPSDDQLRQLLAGQLSDEAAGPLTGHTDQCADCQRRLERLSEDATSSRWRQLLRPSDDEPGPTKIAAPDPPPLAQTKPFMGPTPDGALLRRLQERRRGPVVPPSLPGYQILDELGRGGMGVVYKARQVALKRLVALKVIASGAWAGADEVNRFCAEAQAVAQLQHPNIVQVHEIGDYEGRPYFSLEYVEGGSLDERLGGTPLPPRPAAELVHTLARAMHYAHEHGIVHRDLKPANVLLSFSRERPASALPGALAGRSRLNEFIPKIADFGLAKRLGGDSGLSHTGMIVGTPSYMAPEQAEGRVHEIGPAADVYALGAILYECLTGRPPFKGATSVETLQQVQTQTPVSPKRLQPALPRDLETICLKCLEKEPARRYASALALADDLERFLAGRPIQARPAGVAERTWKWAKRRPAVAALLGGLVFALAALFVVLVWSYVRVSRSAEKAKKQARFAQSVVEDMYTNVAEEWLADEPQKDPLQKEFLEKALNYYEALTREDDSDPESRRGAALAYFRVGQLRRTLNQPAEAAEAYHQAIALQQKLHDEASGERRYRQDLANSYNWLGELLRDGGGSLREAEDNYRLALALQERLIEEDPGEPTYRRELARSHSNLGLVEMDTDRAEQAGKDFDRAVDLLEKLVEDHPTNDFRHELARTLTNRGVFHRSHRRLEKADADYRRAIGLLEGLRGTGRVRVVYQFNLAIAYLDRGNILYDRQENEKALAELSRAQAILTRLVDDFPGRPRYRKKLARTYLSRGSALAECNRLREAEANCKEARQLFAELIRQYPEDAEHQADLGKCLGNLGLLKFQQGDLPAAGDLLKEAADLLCAALKPNPLRLDYREALRDQYQNLAETRVRAGDCAGAVQAAADLAGVFPKRALGHYYAACFVARCVPLDEKKGDADAARQHAEQAAGLLREALDRGLTGKERLTEKEEKDIFGPLAQRPAWADLLKELEARPRPAKSPP